MSLRLLERWAREREETVRTEVLQFLGDKPSLRYLEAPVVDRLCWSLPAVLLSPEAQARLLLEVFEKLSYIGDLLRILARIEQVYSAGILGLAAIAARRRLGTHDLKLVHVVLSVLHLAYEHPFALSIAPLVTEAGNIDEVAVVKLLHTRRRLGVANYGDVAICTSALGYFIAETEQFDLEELTEVYSVYRQVISTGIVEALRRILRSHTSVAGTCLVSAYEIHGVISEKLRGLELRTSLGREFVERLINDVKYWELLVADILAKLFFAYPLGAVTGLVACSAVSGWARAAVLVSSNLCR
jgi:hypothetical protein